LPLHQKMPEPFATTWRGMMGGATANGGAPEKKGQRLKKKKGA
jgi:hypothetical protein